MRCYCHREFDEGDRKFTLVADWGADDVRPDTSKDYEFCSYKCIADWATDRAAHHDGLVHKQETYE